MADLDAIRTPALVLDLDVLDANLDRMAARARELGVSLRPHVKTHKCIEIGRRQVERGAAGITVSTLFEAQAFADHGFDDILWAFPIVLNRIPEAVDLARRITLRVAVDGPEAVAALRAAGAPMRVWIKVDCGYHRAGVDPGDPASVALARAIDESPTLTLDGILSHSGHAYDRSTEEGRAAVAEEERRVMAGFAARLRQAGLDLPNVSVGSTPAMTAARSLEGVTECRPGNYALFDFTQVALGSCAAGDCAATVLASVVSSQPGATHCVVDAGALAMSKDPGPEGIGPATMGRIFDDDGSLDPETHLFAVSQEHGKVNRRLPVGTRVRILPNHSCLTVAQFDEMVVVQGNRVVDRWRVWRGRD